MKAVLLPLGGGVSLLLRSLPPALRDVDLWTRLVGFEGGVEFLEGGVDDLNIL